MNRSRYTIVSIGEDLETVFDLERASDLSGLHPEMILEFLRAGLVHAHRPGEEGGPQFDEIAITRLRQIERLRRREGVSLRTLCLIMRLLDRIEDLDGELRTLRERMR